MRWSKVHRATSSVIHLYVSVCLIEKVLVLQLVPHPKNRPKLLLNLFDSRRCRLPPLKASDFHNLVDIVYHVLNDYRRLSVFHTVEEFG